MRTDMLKFAEPYAVILAYTHGLMKRAVALEIVHG